jgi:hypothetical protein
MNVLVAYSRPRGRYGKYIFTVMIYFSEPTEKVEIAVVRPQTKTEIQNVYSCDHCGRWHTIRTHVTTTTPQILPQSEHRKDGRLELYRYDNVEPNDWIELTLRDSELLKYQWAKLSINWKTVSLRNYWRNPKKDEDWNNYIQARRQQSFTQQDRQNYFREEKMTNEMLYEVTLLDWDEYMQSKTDGMRVEEELIRQTMQAEKISITDLLLEPTAQPISIEGSKHFIEGQLKYLE